MLAVAIGAGAKRPQEAEEVTSGYAKGPSCHVNGTEQHAASLTRRLSEQLSTDLPVRPEALLYIVSGAHQAELTGSLQHWKCQ